MYVSAGDYWLIATGTSPTITGARRSAYAAIRKVHAPNSPFYRLDIGRGRMGRATAARAKERLRYRIELLMKDRQTHFSRFEELSWLTGRTSTREGMAETGAGAEPKRFPSEGCSSWLSRAAVRVSQAQQRFNAIMLRKMELYRMDAIDALRDLAMMPISDNALLNQVKYMAACRLAGPQQETRLRRARLTLRCAS